jgi:hypothetical protein
MGGFTPTCHAQTFVEVAKLEFLWLCFRSKMADVKHRGAAWQPAMAMQFGTPTSHQILMTFRSLKMQKQLWMPATHNKKAHFLAVTTIAS